MAAAHAFEIIRSDDVRECVFAVTRNRNYTNFGEIAVNADRLRFILPPKASGSAKTFDYLSKIDPDGLGQARNVINATDTDEAIRMALSDENAVSFFVQFPDPSNERFRNIRELNGHLVPVIDSIILRQKIDGRTVYFAKETQISQLKWLNLGRRVVTVCTPMIVFTGATEQSTGTDRAANTANSCSTSAPWGAKTSSRAKARSPASWTRRANSPTAPATISRNSR